MYLYICLSFEQQITWIYYFISGRSWFTIP